MDENTLFFQEIRSQISGIGLTGEGSYMESRNKESRTASRRNSKPHSSFRFPVTASIRSASFGPMAQQVRVGTP